MAEHILKDIREALGLEPTDTSRDEEILSLSPDDQFNLWCQWNGLIGWNRKLVDVFEELFIEYDDTVYPTEIRWKQ